MDRGKHGGRVVRCSFCGRARDQVQKLIAGPGVYICEKCIELCNEILEEGGPPAPRPAAPGTGRWRAAAGPSLLARLRRLVHRLTPARA